MTQTQTTPQHSSERHQLDWENQLEAMNERLEDHNERLSAELDFHKSELAAAREDRKQLVTPTMRRLFWITWAIWLAILALELVDVALL